jgi:hypothetical protein
VEKYGTARQATGGDTIRPMRVACWIPKATNTHSEYVIIVSHCNNGCRKARQFYVFATFPVLLSYVSVSLDVAKILKSM